jgi:hypothetical protein
VCHFGFPVIFERSGPPSLLFVLFSLSDRISQHSHHSSLAVQGVGFFSLIFFSLFSFSDRQHFSTLAPFLADGLGFRFFFSFYFISRFWQDFSTIALFLAGGPRTATTCTTARFLKKFSP